MMDLNQTLNQMDLIDTYRLFHPTAAGYILINGTWYPLKDRSCDRA